MAVKFKAYLLKILLHPTGQCSNSAPKDYFDYVYWLSSSLNADRCKFLESETDYSRNEKKTDRAELS